MLTTNVGGRIYLVIGIKVMVSDKPVYKVDVHNL